MITLEDRPAPGDAWRTGARSAWRLIAEGPASTTLASTSRTRATAATLITPLRVFRTFGGGRLIHRYFGARAGGLEPADGHEDDDGAALAAPSILQLSSAYLPTVRLTLNPFLRFLLLAFGLCLMTR